MQTMQDTSSFRLGDWLVLPELHRLRRGDQELTLEPKVMQVLLCLAATPGEVVSHDDLIERVWEGMAVSGNVVTYSIAELRKALGDDWRNPRYVETISKSGYRLVMPVSTGEETELATGSPSRRMWAGGAAAGALLALGIVGAARVLTPFGDTAARPLQPVPLTTFPGSEVQPTLSPDGNHVAFAWMKEGRDDRDLYVTLVGAETPSPLATSADHERSPAWSPDGLYVAYARWRVDGGDCGIYKIPAVGGSSDRIADCPGRPIGNMSFSPDGTRLAVGALGPAGEPAQIFVIRLADGHTWQVGDPPPDRQGDYYPVFSPDGERIVFNRFRGDGLSDLYTVSPDGGKPTRVTFDNRDIGGADWSADGRTIYFSSYRSGQYTLWSVPASGGEPEPVALNAHNIVSLSVSEEQRRIVYSSPVTDVNLWATRLEGPGTPLASPERVAPRDSETPGFWARHQEPHRLLSSTRWEAHPQISPDGARVAFASDRSGTFEIYSAALDGSALRRHTSFGGPFVGSPRWSPDGAEIVFDARPEGQADLWTVGAESATPRRLTDHPDDDFAASFSGDGSWIYFTSHRSGSWQIWRMPALGGEPEPLTTAGGYSALEGPGGDHLYYTKYGEDGIWRRRLAASASGRAVRGRREEKIYDGLDILDWGSWLVRPEGLWMLAQSPPAVVLYRPETGELVPILPLSGAIARQTPALSVSPDGSF